MVCLLEHSARTRVEATDGARRTGNWYKYGQDPQNFISLWRRMANRVRAATNRTALVWAPNTAGGYPFPGGAYTPPKGDPRFDQMDTNKDGVLNSQVRILFPNPLVTAPKR